MITTLFGLPCWLVTAINLLAIAIGSILLIIILFYVIYLSFKIIDNFPRRDKPANKSIKKFGSIISWLFCVIFGLGFVSVLYMISYESVCVSKPQVTAVRHSGVSWELPEEFLSISDVVATKDGVRYYYTISYVDSLNKGE